jgi:hypothetical protein
LEIINDINSLNRNLKKMPNWKNSAKKIIGKTNFDLIDFDNWNLDEILKKL